MATADWDWGRFYRNLFDPSAHASALEDVGGMLWGLTPWGAQQEALEAQKDIEQQKMAFLRRQYEEGKQLYQPFYEGGLGGLSLYGQRIAQDPFAMDISGLLRPRTPFEAPTYETTPFGQYGANAPFGRYIPPGWSGAPEIPEYTAPEAWDPTAFTESPEYQALLGEGVKAIEATAAAGGKQFAGETLEDIQEFGTNLAAQKMQEDFARYMSQRGMGLEEYMGAALPATGMEYQMAFEPYQFARQQQFQEMFEPYALEQELGLKKYIGELGPLMGQYQWEQGFDYGRIGDYLDRMRQQQLDYLTATGGLAEMGLGAAQGITGALGGYTGGVTQALSNLGQIAGARAMIPMTGTTQLMNMIGPLAYLWA